MLEIREVNTKADIKKFAKFPIKLYKGCPYFVPSFLADEINAFNPNKNINFEKNIVKGFLCYKDGKLAGRVMAIINPEDNKNTGENKIRFSRIEAIDDIEVFGALLNAVEKFGKENGMEIIHGPWGFTDQDREGMLTEGFDRISTYATAYSYPYYSKYMRELGYGDESKWVERSFTIPEKPYEKIVRIADRLKQKYHLRELADEMSVKEIIKKYGYKLFDTVNEAYGHLDGYVPVEGRAVDELLGQFKMIVNSRYISVLLDENDEVAAFGIVLPSIAKPLNKSKGKLFPTGFIGLLRSIKHPKELEMALIGVKKIYQNSGINAIVISRIMNNIIEDGIMGIESNPMLETNFNIQQLWKFAENQIVKKRQTYKKQIDA